MKKTAVLLYDSFCNFEISPALEVLALAEKPMTVFGIAKQPIKSEDGLSVFPDDTIDHLDLDEYDSLLLPGAMDIREAIENEKIIDFRENNRSYFHCTVIACKSRISEWKTIHGWRQ